jgi:hypothetical protein
MESSLGAMVSRFTSLLVNRMRAAFCRNQIFEIVGLFACEWIGEYAQVLTNACLYTDCMANHPT